MCQSDQSARPIRVSAPTCCEDHPRFKQRNKQQHKCTRTPGCGTDLALKSFERICLQQGSVANASGHVHSRQSMSASTHQAHGIHALHGSCRPAHPLPQAQEQIWGMRVVTRGYSVGVAMRSSAACTCTPDQAQRCDRDVSLYTGAAQQHAVHCGSPCGVRIWPCKPEQARLQQILQDVRCRKQHATMRRVCSSSMPGPDGHPGGSYRLRLILQHGRSPVEGLIGTHQGRPPRRV